MLNLDETEMIRLYVEENKTCKQIGKMLNCGSTTIHRRLKSNNINTIFPHNKNLEVRKKSQEIIKLYREELMNTKEIGKIFNCSSHIIKNILKENKVKMCHSKRMKTLYKNGKIKVWNKDLTKEMDNSVMNISKNLTGRHHSEKTLKKLSKIRRKMVEEGILCGFKKGHKINNGRKHSDESKKNYRLSRLGEKNPAWKGGIAFEPYDKRWNEKFKRAIRKRDNQICMLCGIHRERLSKALNVHHIDYNKLLSIPQNCISLCRGCHSKTNKDREVWTKHFQSLLNKRYDYQYSENQEIIQEIVLNLNQEGGNK